MQINISLPKIGTEQTPEEVRGFLRQLELSVHHAQKSLKEIEAMEKERGNDAPSTYVCYRLFGVEDTGTGDRFEAENPAADRIEIEIRSE